MRVDFFDTPCKEPSRSDVQFGICDNQDGSKAYTTTEDELKWIGVVKNNPGKEIVFTPIDNCITVLKNNGRDQESTCDGMLTFDNSLFLVELKDKERDWKTRAKEQLENTIKLLHESHDLTRISNKKAFACNRRHPKFEVLELSEKKEFSSKTNGFIIDIQSEIIIK